MLLVPTAADPPRNQKRRIYLKVQRLKLGYMSMGGKAADIHMLQGTRREVGIEVVKIDVYHQAVVTRHEAQYL